MPSSTIPDEMPSIELSTLIEKESAAAFFQPVVSVQRKQVVGLESRGWGIDPSDRRLIPPEELSRMGGSPEQTLTMDRLLRHKALEGFKDLQGQMPGLVLFLGMDASVLRSDVVGSGHLAEKVRSMGLDPNSVVIELSWVPGMDLEAVKRFMDAYRLKGFLFSLRDLDIRRESLDRVFHLQPDVFKLDPSLVGGVSKDAYRRNGLKSLVSLGHRMGGLVVANGVENEEDALVCLENGADMLQGGYFSKPQKPGTSATLGLKARIVFVASRYKRLLTERIGKDKDRKVSQEKLSRELEARWSAAPPSDPAAFFKGLLRNYPAIECLYLLNQDGVQSTETVCNTRKLADRKKYLFQPAAQGADHSLKEYYYAPVFNGAERYFTEPYVSLASGHLCVTGSVMVPLADSGGFGILCFDLDILRPWGA